MTIGPRPEYPQTTVDKVASAFELDFVYLIDCLSVCRQIFSLYNNVSRDHRGVTWERQLARSTRSYIGTAVERAVEDNITCF